eukprot:166329_1
MMFTPSQTINCRHCLIFGFIRNNIKIQEVISHDIMLICCQYYHNVSFNSTFLHYDPGEKNWFITYETAEIQYIYSDQWNIKITEIYNGKITKTYKQYPINSDLQWTVLSTEKFFCSFYAPIGPAFGIQFKSYEDLQNITGNINKIIDINNKIKVYKSKIINKIIKKKENNMFNNNINKSDKYLVFGYIKNINITNQTIPSHIIFLCITFFCNAAFAAKYFQYNEMHQDWEKIENNA